MNYFSISAIIIYGIMYHNTLAGMDQEKSLFTYCNVAVLEHQSHDIKELIAGKLLGRGGWWYTVHGKPGNGFPRTAALHHDSESALVAYNQNKNAYVWNLQSAKSVPLLHDAEVAEVAYNRTGTLLATATFGSSVHVWNAQYQNIRSLTSSILWHHLFFNAQDTVLSDGEVVWYLEEERVSHLYTSHRTPLVAAANYQGRDVLAITADYAQKGVKVHEIENKNQLLLPHEFSLEHLAFTPDAKTLYTIDSCYTLRAWDAAGNKKEEPLKGIVRGKDKICDLLVQEEGGLVASQNWDIAMVEKAGIPYKADNIQHIRITDLNGNAVVTAPKESPLRGLKFNRDGSAFLVVADAELIVYKRYKKPMLEHLLFRSVLNRYFKECIAKQKKPALCTTQEALVPWMVAKFKIRESDLQNAWDSMPSDLQTSIFNTLVYRAGVIGKESAK